MKSKFVFVRFVVKFGEAIGAVDAEGRIFMRDGGSIVVAGLVGIVAGCTSPQTTVADPVALSAQTSPRLPAVSSAMQRMVDEGEVAGAVTLITTKDRIVHLDANGLADIASRKPMQTDALFWLASTTKMFPGVAILMLQDEGKLSLDDPVAKYIPEFSKLRTPSGKPANISIKQLLTHTSGLGKLPMRYYLTGHLSGLVRGILGAPMQFEPGERFGYTGSGFDVAGRVVEVVSGKTFDAFLKERLFDPLGMRDTTFYPNRAQRRRLPTGYFKDWSDGTLRVQASPAPLYLLFMLPLEPGGGLYSTAADLARFAQMLLNRGMLDQKRYLSESSYTLLTTNQVGDLLDPFIGYGLGVNVIRSPHAGMTAFLSAGTFSHQGAWGTHVIIDPSKGLAYVLLVQRAGNHPSNFDNPQTRAFLEAAADALGTDKQIPKPEAARAEPARAATANVSGDVHDLSKVDATPRPKFLPRPQYPVELRQVDTGGQIQVDFIVDQDGNVQNARAHKASLAGNTVEKTGDVVIQMAPFTITADGGKISASASNSSGIGAEDAAKLIEASAIEAVSKWKFAAGRRGGRVVDTHMQVPMVFRINKQAGGPAPKTDGK